MALTRKMLKAMGIEEEKIDQIIEAHVEATDAIKEKFGDYETIKNDLKKVTKERDDYANQPKPDDKSEQIEKLEKEIEKYKSAETLAEKKAAYKELLKESGIDEKRFNSIMKLTDFNSIELENGKIKSAEELSKSIKTDFADFIVTTTHKPHDPNTPPPTTPAKPEPKTLAEALQMKYKGE